MAAVGGTTLARVRPPRAVRFDRVLAAFSLYEAEGAAMLRLVAHPGARAAHYLAHAFLHDEQGQTSLGPWWGCLARLGCPG